MTTTARALGALAILSIAHLCAPSPLLAQNTPQRFARSTMLGIPALFDQLPDGWIESHLPLQLLQPGPFDVLWWQWLALPVLVIVGFVIGSLLSRIARAIISRIVARTSTEWDDVVLESVSGPLTAGLSLIAVAALVPLLSFYPQASDEVYRLIRAGYYIVVFWALWRLVDVARQMVTQSQWARTSSTSRALVPIASRVAKVMLLAVATVAVLSMLGYPAASLIAGLGLSGLAFALAAQKTIENLFGAFSIGVDRPFSEGDFVKVDDFVGTVETLGLRSTRFRTLDRTLISMPNGRLADMRLESYSARDRMRLATTLGLVYETTSSMMRGILTELERVLRAHPKIWPDAVVVRFSAFGESSLDVEIMAWFETPDYSEFQLIRQEILLQFMDVVEAAGSSFAFPTRTLHVASMPEIAGK